MDWQPIETAPRDGTPVLLAGGEDDTARYMTDDEARRMRAPTRGWWTKGDGWVITLAEAGYVAVIRNDPTHWMPLPEPPQTQPE